MKQIRIILNGKGAANPQVRAAIERIRGEGQPLEVRATWESGDAARFAREALDEGVEVLVAGGGDGTINEVSNGILEANASPEMALGILPLGTANDFARGCGVPLDPYDALTLAATGSPVAIDVPSVNGVSFVNVASGGFGAEVTVGTPTKLKKAMGGGAYALVGIVTAAKMTPYSGRVSVPGEENEGTFIVMAVGNGCQAGGGLRVTPDARIDDGLMDILFISDFQPQDLGLVMQELEDHSNTGNRFVHYRQVTGCQVDVPGKVPINLDGEPYRWDHMTFKIRPRCLPVVLPDGCQLLAGSSLKEATE